MEKKSRNLFFDFFVTIQHLIFYITLENRIVSDAGFAIMNVFVRKINCRVKNVKFAAQFEI